ncbi:MAG: hypothetical protein Q9218_004181 [Villophora microphyllina]
MAFAGIFFRLSILPFVHAPCDRNDKLFRREVRTISWLKKSTFSQIFLSSFFACSNFEDLSSSTVHFPMLSGNPYPHSVRKHHLCRSIKRRENIKEPSPGPIIRERELQKIIASDYAATDPSLERRRYEINMLLLFRDVQMKQFLERFSNDVDVYSLESYKRLRAFVNDIPGKDMKYQESRNLFTKDKGFFTEKKEHYLTELAVYWRSQPDQLEMFEYKDIWELVAQRPLAWEGLLEWRPCLANERMHTITRNPVKKNAKARCWPQTSRWSFRSLSRRIVRRVSTAFAFTRASNHRHRRGQSRG